MTEKIISHGHDYFLFAPGEDVEPLVFLRVLETHSYNVFHEGRLVAIHPCHSTRGHLLMEAVEILDRSHLLSAAEVSLAQKRLYAAARETGSN